MVSVRAVFVASFLSACSSTPINPSDADAGTPTTGDAAPNQPAPACTSSQDCALVSDCRCGDGSIQSGRSCEAKACLTRNQFCGNACSSHGSWIANPEGCWYWTLVETKGSGVDYRGAQAGCASGAKLVVSKPNRSDLAWCVPMTECTSDADCPTAATSVTGVDWRCHEAVTGGQSGHALRWCMDKQETLCNMR